LLFIIYYFKSAHEEQLNGVFYMHCCGVCIYRPGCPSILVTNWLSTASSHAAASASGDVR